MSTPEQRIYNQLVSTLGKLLPRGRFFIQRIENAVSIGMPDLVVLYNGQTYWVETKTTKYRLSEAQWAWFSRSSLCGVPVVLVTVVEQQGGPLLRVYAPVEAMLGRSLGSYLKEYNPNGHPLALGMSIEEWLGLVHQSEDLSGAHP